MLPKTHKLLKLSSASKTEFFLCAKVLAIPAKNVFVSKNVYKNLTFLEKYIAEIYIKFLLTFPYQVFNFLRDSSMGANCVWITSVVLSEETPQGALLRIEPGTSG